jgi:hypothetical protein
MIKSRLYKTKNQLILLLRKNDNDLFRMKQIQVLILNRCKMRLNKMRDYKYIQYKKYSTFTMLLISIFFTLFMDWRELSV